MLTISENKLATLDNCNIDDSNLKETKQKVQLIAKLYISLLIYETSLCIKQRIVCLAGAHNLHNRGNSSGIQK